MGLKEADSWLSSWQPIVRLVPESERGGQACGCVPCLFLQRKLRETVGWHNRVLRRDLAFREEGGQRLRATPWTKHTRVCACPAEPGVGKAPQIGADRGRTGSSSSLKHPAPMSRQRRCLSRSAKRRTPRSRAREQPARPHRATSNLPAALPSCPRSWRKRIGRRKDHLGRGRLLGDGGRPPRR